MVLSHPENEVEDRDERPDSVGVSTKHNVTEADVVVGRDMACSDAREGGLIYRESPQKHSLGRTHLLVELDVLHNLQRQSEITQKTMYAAKADDTEVTEHPVEGAGAVLANNLTASVRIYSRVHIM